MIHLRLTKSLRNRWKVNQNWSKSKRTQAVGCKRNQRLKTQGNRHSNTYWHPTLLINWIPRKICKSIHTLITRSSIKKNKKQNKIKVSNKKNKKQKEKKVRKSKKSKKILFLLSTLLYPKCKERWRKDEIRINKLL